MLSTDKAWEKFGRDDPYFGVLAHRMFTTKEIEKNREEFFASGIGTIAQVIRRYEDHFGELQRESALDHGCGVGRLTFALAEQFASVVGLDVSQSMLTEAKANAKRSDVSNVRFAPSDDQLSNALGAFDFVNSHMVLQHIPVRRGLRIMSNLLDRVRHGGGFHLHFSIRTDRLRSRALWWASHHVPGIKIFQNLRAGRPWNAPAMQMNNYPINRVVALLASRHIAQFIISTERHAEFLTVSIIGRAPVTSEAEARRE